MAEFKVFLGRAVRVIGLVVVLTILGTFAFMALPGWNVGDALFMTIITLSAVGYEEVRPLDEAGRLIAALLLAGGVTAMGLWFAVLTSVIVEADLGQVFRRRRTMRKIQQLKSHVIVCGGGRTGLQVVRELEYAEVPFVIIERDPDQAAAIRGLREGILVLEADATKDETLGEAHIWSARGLVTALSNDTDNVFVCLSAHALREDLEIVARASDEEAMSKLYKAGASHVINPILMGGRRMAATLLWPQVVNFLDIVMRGEDLSLRMEELTVPANSPVVGTTIEQAQLQRKTGLILIALRHSGEGERFIYNPGPEVEVRPEDDLIVLGKPEQIESLHQVVGT